MVQIGVLWVIYVPCLLYDLIVYIEGSFLGADSNITELAVVPISNTHEDNSIIESDRVLMILGNMTSSFGHAALLLYDGLSFTPYLMAAMSNGSPGLASSLVSSITNFTFTQTRK